MPEKQWNQCKCGIVTDPDAKKCPHQGLKDNPEHQLEKVRLSDEEVKKLNSEGKVYSKNQEWLLKL